MESGWGTSRFAREGNALFGQRGTGGDYLVAEGNRSAHVRAFSSLADSVRSYMANLNGHPSYRGLRRARAEARRAGAELSAGPLLAHLGSYAEDDQYAARLAGIIESNGFTAFARAAAGARDRRLSRNAAEAQRS